MKTLLLLLLPIPFLLFCKNNIKKEVPNSDQKIIIIGPGVAGLSTAKYFQDNDIEVTISEAQDIIGGKVKTNPS